MKKIRKHAIRRIAAAGGISAAIFLTSVSSAFASSVTKTREFQLDIPYAIALSVDSEDEERLEASIHHEHAIHDEILSSDTETRLEWEELGLSSAQIHALLND